MSVQGSSELQKLKEVMDAREELAAAFKSAGVSFPAMDVRLESTYGLIALGEVSPATAREMASVIARGAGL
ncbi:hypothetical protein AN217_25485 [Streptomyces qinglanensis]|uniref:Uncharacterized protein n=1 Tax=Streptomyces qinglanensis TaxID=943816 RepID=A0A1E7K9K7_9ACTN|nr:hypothetical protein [Streptomyces qinglanensis]OEV00596.1 hypothetical protein AN217_25485 [Streptomyces qinglanensis]OEV07664.1 hypothetical protein AN220_33725 [Streptomyces nanshensis]